MIYEYTINLTLFALCIISIIILINLVCINNDYAVPSNIISSKTTLAKYANNNYIITLTLSVLCIIFIITIINLERINNDYAIPNNINSFKTEIAKYYDNNYTISVKDTLDIQDKKIILFLVNNKYIGKALFEKGIYNRYRKVSISFTRSDFYRSFLLYLNDKTEKYLIVLGKNYYNNISKIKASILRNKDNELDEYIFPLTTHTNNAYFISKYKIDTSNFTYEYLPSDIIFLDKYSNDITEELRSEHRKYMINCTN